MARKARNMAGMAAPTMGSYSMPKPKIAPAPAKDAPRVRTGIGAANNMAKARSAYRGKTPKAG